MQRSVTLENFLDWPLKLAQGHAHKHSAFLPLQRGRLASSKKARYLAEIRRCQISRRTKIHVQDLCDRDAYWMEQEQARVTRLRLPLDFFLPSRLRIRPCVLVLPIMLPTINTRPSLLQLQIWQRTSQPLIKLISKSI